VCVCVSEEHPSRMSEEHPSRMSEEHEDVRRASVADAPSSVV
jgi:hypothetical protein